MKTTVTTNVPLNSDQMFLVGFAARLEISRRYAERNRWLTPAGTIPARPEYAAMARDEIRALIDAVRTIEKAKRRAWHREALRRAA